MSRIVNLLNIEEECLPNKKWKVFAEDGGFVEVIAYSIYEDAKALIFYDVNRTVIASFTRYNGWKQIKHDDVSVCVHGASAKTWADFL